MTGYFVANGVSCENFNIILSDAGIYKRAEKDVETVTVPGKNGELLISNDRYNNVDVTYPAVCLEDFDRCYRSLVDYLLAQEGYLRIEDSFHPDEYIMAQFVGETEPTRVTLNDQGTFNLQFRRKPQRFLKSGEIPITYTSSGMIFNDCYPAALPLVRVYGTGILGIGSVSISINSVSEYVDLDCEMMNAYKGLTNCNADISAPDGFFKIKHGQNNISLGTGITKVIITPRWFSL